MRKLITLLTILTVIHACNNANSSNKAPGSDKPELTQLTGPDASDLLQTLQGRWQNQDDSAYVLEIVDTKMRHIRNGSLSVETDIEVDGSCVISPCKVDTTNLRDGWCFTEKGQHDIQCNIVIDCDKEFLKYNVIGSENVPLVFKKL